MTKITVGILKPGSAPEKLAAAQGDYDDRFRVLFGQQSFDFVTYSIENGAFPKSATAADAWIITGSRHAVYEDHPWIRPLEALIQDIQAAGRPMVGICFGHQIVAQALGGKVQRAETGWIAGPQRYRDAMGNSFFVNAWHRDQVVEIPPGAEVFASAEGCPVAGLRYPGPILTLQPHPEFGPDYLIGLLEERGGNLPLELQDYVRRSAQEYPPDLHYVIDLLEHVLKAGEDGAPRPVKPQHDELVDGVQ
jgi:GMP synthase (glutamine-hydrolysing)